jgi:hypothetical protein
MTFDDDGGHVSWREPVDGSVKARPKRVRRRKSIRRFRCANLLASLRWTRASSPPLPARRAWHKPKVLWVLVGVGMLSAASVFVYVDRGDGAPDVAVIDDGVRAVVETPAFEVVRPPLSSTAPVVAEPATTGDDLVVVVNELFRFKTDLEHNPEPAKVAMIYAAGSAAYGHFLHDIEVRAASGNASTRNAPDVVAMNVVERAGDNRVTVDSTTSYDDGRFIERFVLVRGDDGRWRIADHRVL